MVELILFFLSFLFVFGILVFVHELGHFVAAKLSKVRVIEFGFGFPPALYKKKKGGTTYSINSVPMGGFVKLLGEDGGDADNPESFASKNKLTKAKIISAGVIMNLLLAGIIFTLLYSVGFSPMLPDAEKHAGVKQHVYVATVEEGTPAFKAGLLTKDELIKIGGREISDIEIFREEIKNNVSKSVNLEVLRDREIKSFAVVPYMQTIEGQEIARIGITHTNKIKASNIFSAVLAGFSENFRLIKMTLQGLVGFLGRLFTTFTVGSDVVGPVGIAVLTDQVRQLGFLFLLQFVAILSVSLALVNILPIPGLDGGYLFLMLLEKIRGKDISANIKNALTLIGLALLII